MGEIFLKWKSSGLTRPGQILSAFYFCVPLHLVLDVDIVMQGM